MILLVMKPQGVLTATPHVLFELERRVNLSSVITALNMFVSENNRLLIEIQELVIGGLCPKSHLFAQNRTFLVQNKL